MDPMRELLHLAKGLKRAIEADMERSVRPVAFPMEVLPPELCKYVGACARGARVPPGAVALPMLAMAGAILGRRVRIEVGPGWVELPGLWVALVGESGSGKTPALRMARAPFSLLDQESMAAGETRPVVTSGGSISYLAWVLEERPGVAVVRDELVGLSRQWQRRGGDERQRFLSLWSNEPLVHVGPAGAEVVSVAEPVVGILGGVQVAMLGKLGGVSEDGLLERFVPVGVPVRGGYWQAREARGSAPDVAGMVDALRGLSSMDPVVVGMSAAAGVAWQRWYNDTVDAARVVSAEGRGFFGKLPEQAARCALVLHVLWGGRSEMDEAGMARATALGTYVRSEVLWHLRRMQVGIRLVGPPPLGRRIERVLAEAGDAEGWLDRSSMRTALGRSIATEAFDAALDEAMEEGTLECREVRGEGGGRVRREYRVVGRE